MQRRGAELRALRGTREGAGDLMSVIGAGVDVAVGHSLALPSKIEAHGPHLWPHQRLGTLVETIDGDVTRRPVFGPQMTEEGIRSYEQVKPSFIANAVEAAAIRSRSSANGQTYMALLDATDGATYIAPAFTEVNGAFVPLSIDGRHAVDAYRTLEFDPASRGGPSALQALVGVNSQITHADVAAQIASDAPLLGYGAQDITPATVSGLRALASTTSAASPDTASLLDQLASAAKPTLSRDIDVVAASAPVFRMTEDAAVDLSLRYPEIATADTDRILTAKDDGNPKGTRFARTIDSRDYVPGTTGDVMAEARIRARSTGQFHLVVPGIAGDPTIVRPMTGTSYQLLQHATLTKGSTIVTSKAYPNVDVDELRREHHLLAEVRSTLGGDSRAVPSTGIKTTDRELENARDWRTSLAEKRDALADLREERAAVRGRRTDKLRAAIDLRIAATSTEITSLERAIADNRDKHVAALAAPERDLALRAEIARHDAAKPWRRRVGEVLAPKLDDTWKLRIPTGMIGSDEVPAYTTLDQLAIDARARASNLQTSIFAGLRSGDEHVLLEVPGRGVQSLRELDVSKLPDDVRFLAAGDRYLDRTNMSANFAPSGASAQAG